MDSEQLIIKATVRAHILTDETTALCRDIVGTAYASGLSIPAALELTDDKYIDRFKQWKKLSGYK